MGNQKGEQGDLVVGERVEGERSCRVPTVSSEGNSAGNLRIEPGGGGMLERDNKEIRPVEDRGRGNVEYGRREGSTDRIAAVRRTGFGEGKADGWWRREKNSRRFQENDGRSSGELGKCRWAGRRNSGEKKKGGATGG